MSIRLTSSTKNGIKHKQSGKDRVRFKISQSQGG